MQNEDKSGVPQDQPSRGTHAKEYLPVHKKKRFYVHEINSKETITVTTQEYPSQVLNTCML
jgi:hypothetical protein